MTVTLKSSLEQKPIMGFNRLTLRRIILLLSSIFLLIATAYNLLIPIFEASDETLHYPYVKHLADGNGLPVAGQDLLLKQEATQGPLFYALAALATFWIDTDDLQDLLDYNPHWADTTFRPLNDNQNRIAHGPADQFPYQGAARAVHIGRMVSILFGLLAVVCTVLIADELFPGQRWLALGAGALAAFNPQFIRTSATVSNDSASTALVALLVLLALRWRQARLTIWQITGLGLLAGLAILAKLNGIIGLGLIMVILLGEVEDPGNKADRVVMQERKGTLKQGSSHPLTPASSYPRSPVQITPAPYKSWLELTFTLAGILVMAILVAGWWFGRNWLLYGELTASDAHLNLAGRGYLSWAELISLWPEIERTFWASFGWGQIRVADWVYIVLRWGRYLAMAGLVFLLLKSRSAAMVKRVGFLVVWLLVGLGMLFQWISLVGSVSHARLLFPALPAIAILGALGLGQWVPDSQDQRWRLILPAYTPPPPLQPSQVPTHLPALNLTYAGGLRLLAADVPVEVVKPGETFSVDLFWQGVAGLDKNYSVFIRVLDTTGAVIAGRDTYPGLGLLPTKHWPPGKIVKDHYPLTIPSDFSNGPLVANIVVGLFDFESETRAGFPAINEAGEVVNPLVARVKIIPQVWPDIEPSHPLEVVFGDNIHLAGYDWACSQNCRLTLYWTPQGAPSAAYTVFIQHWVGDTQVAGFDGPSREGAYPTDWWAVDEVIIDRHQLPLLSEGTLLVGLYDLESGLRVPILAADVEHRDQALVIEIP
jgi:hypothetical protein